MLINDEFIPDADDCVKLKVEPVNPSAGLSGRIKTDRVGSRRLAIEPFEIGSKEINSDHADWIG
jgi:hypothetical protein